MSKVAIKGADTGTGVFTLESPATNTDRTLTIPDVDGSIVTADASGNVGIGTSLPSTKLEIKADSNSTTDWTFTARNSAGSAVTEIGGYGYNHNLYHRFWINDSEEMRIDSSGNLLVGTDVLPDASNNGTAIRDTQNGASRFSGSGTGGRTVLAFYNGNGLVGQVSTSGSSTSYVTSSDYRLKENVVGVTGASARVQQLNPVRFNFIADPDRTVDGFLAHEVQDVVPEAITGVKDAVDAEGNPDYQGIDQSKLVPLLTAALQEALARIETLEADVATSKGNA